MNNLPEIMKRGHAVQRSGYREGVRAERKRTIEAIDKIIALNEIEAREMLKAYKEHLLRQE